MIKIIKEESYRTNPKYLDNPSNLIGLWWDYDGHKLFVTDVKGDKVTVKEEWIAEDTYEPVTEYDTCTLKVDRFNEPYIEFPITKSKFYLQNAFNYDWLIENEEDEDYEDEYTPSSTNRDYGPSNPWDAPGMSIKDFI